MLDNNIKERGCDGCGSKDNLKRFTTVQAMLSKDEPLIWQYCPECLQKYQDEWPGFLSDFEAFFVEVD